MFFQILGGMMKFKRAVVFLLCVVMGLSVIACRKTPIGGGGDDSDEIDTSIEYTVKFDVGEEARAAGVSTPEDRKVYSGAPVGDLPTRKMEGFTLTGWFDGDTQYVATTKVKSDVTLLAHWKSNAEQDAEAAEYEKNLASWSKPGHLYIHYKTFDHKESEQGTTNDGAPNYDNAISSEAYGDWVLWFWPSSNTNGRLFNAMKIDESGEVFDIDLTKTYTDCGWDGDTNTTQGVSIDYSEYVDKDGFGFLIHKYSSRNSGKHWVSDGGDADLFLSRAKRSDGYYHWFVKQGAVSRGKPNYSKPTEEDKSPYADIEKGSATTKRTPSSADKIIDSSLDNSSAYPVVTSKAAGYENDGVGYQIFMASFADSNGDGLGDIQGIISKLDYLDSLNVDVLWLTPFQSSKSYHGYDIKDYFSVDPRFGTIGDYRELVYKAHQKGIKIVMDFVLNHTAKSNPWFTKSQNLEKEYDDKGNVTVDYRNFYSWINEDEYNALDASAKEQWFGDQYGYYFYSSFSSDMPELNYDYQPVRDAILDVCNYWMSFGLDGFRLDAVKHIYMKNELVGKTPSSGNIDDGKGCVEDGIYSYDLQRNLNFYREFNSRLKKNYPNAILIGENLDGNPRNVTNYYQGLDSQFNFNLYYDATRSFAAAAQPDLNCGYANSAVNKYIEAYYGNSYTKENGESVNVKGYSVVNPGFIDGLFTSNHDLPRARDRLNITTNSTANKDNYRALTAGDIERTDALLRIYYAYVMTMPGLNWIYYGDEIGMGGVMEYTVNSPDGSTDTNKSAPHEDRIYRQPMKWKASGNASFNIGYDNFKAELTGLNATSAIKSVEEQDGDQGSLLNWMRTLTKLRHDYPVLVNGKMQVKDNNGKKVNIYNMEGSTLVYGISNGTQTVKVYINVGDYPFSNVSGNVIASYGYSGGTLGKYGIAIVQG